MSRRARARADTRRAGATTASAISRVEALPTDELLASAVTDVLISGGIERGPTRVCRGGCGCWRSPARGLWGRASSSEAAALLALLERGTRAGANARWEGATTAGAVGVGETLTGDELFASAVADLISPVGVKGRLSDDGGSEGKEGGDGDDDGLHDGGV